MFKHVEAVGSAPHPDPHVEALRSDVGELLRRVAQLTRCVEGLLHDTLPADRSVAGQALHKAARKWLRQQRARPRYLPEELFRDPGWNMLLDLYVQETEQNAVCVSSACMASGVAPTTALRWISILENLQLIARSEDPEDARRQLLCLTPKARHAIEQWLVHTR